MILAVENRLKSVALAGLTVERVSQWQQVECASDAVPLALIGPGKHKYQPSESTDNCQERLKTFQIRLTANAEEIDGLEDEVVAALIGWQIDSYHLPVQMLESDLDHVDGDLYSRVLVFGIRSVIRPRA